MMGLIAEIVIRRAGIEDIPALESLIAASVRGLQKEDYTRRQIDGAMGSVYGTDRQMIGDGSFFVAEAEGIIVACGGWSKRKTAFGSDNSPVKDDGFLDPALDPAKIRGFFVHPNHSRKGIASRILALCEASAAEAGFTAFELVSTLTGVPLYLRHGYVEYQRLTWTLPNGYPYTAIRMRKPFSSP